MRTGERLFAMGVEEGECRAEEKARATARGLVQRWHGFWQRSGVMHDANPGTLNAEWHDGRRCAYAYAVRSACDAFDIERPKMPDDKPPTGGEPAPVDDGPAHGPGCDVRNDRTQCTFDCPKRKADMASRAEDADERWQPGAVWDRTVLGQTVRRVVRARVIRDGGASYVVFANGSSEVISDMTEANGWRYVGPVSEAPSPKPAQEVTAGDVKILAPDGMTLGEVWAALTSSPALRACLDAALRQARESARGTTPAELEAARRDIRAAVLEDAYRAGAEEGRRSAHADGIVEGLRVAKLIARRLYDGDQLGGAGLDALAAEVDAYLSGFNPGSAPADRHVDRAALLQLATGWSARRDEHVAMVRQGLDPAGKNVAAVIALDACIAGIRRLLDAPRDGAPCPGPHQDLEACDACVEPAAAPGHRALAEQIVPAAVYVNERAPYFGPALRPDGAGVMLTSYFGEEDSRDARAKVVEHVAALLSGAAAKSG
jgi:hypothetical protein